jgi:hypothetical protein
MYWPTKWLAAFGFKREYCQREEIMSLDVYLELEDPTGYLAKQVIAIRENGTIREISRAEWDRRFPGCEPITYDEPEGNRTIYHANITHNLGAMAAEAGIYEHLWRPDEIGCELAQDLILPLNTGLETLQNDPERFKELNPSNGWGDYDGLVNFVARYLFACKLNPEARIRIWR